MLECLCGSFVLVFWLQKLRFIDVQSLVSIRLTSLRRAGVEYAQICSRIATSGWPISAISHF